MATGVTTRHSRSCRSRQGERCNCSPSYAAWVWSNRDGKKIWKTFPSQAEAKSWRNDAAGAVRKRELRAPSKVTLDEAAAEFLEGARNGTIRTRAGERYKPSTVRSYEKALRLRVLPELGALRLEEIARADLQVFADRLLDRGLSPSAVSVTIASVRAIYSHALDRSRVSLNPTQGLRLPTPRGRRERIASREEAERLIAAVPVQDRAIWATAMYAGLRLGELRALRWEDVDLGAGVIRVERSWDVKEGKIEPKSRVGRRTVVIPAVLGDPELPGHLVAHRIRTPEPEGLAFGRGGQPFSPTSVRRRALSAWEALGLEPITFHEARHTYASILIDAGANAKSISTYMGHSSIQVTFDRYGKLMPGSEDQVRALLDTYLAGGD